MGAPPPPCRFHWHRFLALVLIAALTWTQAACTSCFDIPIKTADDVRSLQFDPDKRYGVDFETGQKFTRPGTDFQIRDELIGVRLKDGAPYSFYQREQLKDVCVMEKSSGKTTGLIVGIVLGALAAAAGATVGIIYGLGKAQQ